MSSLSDEKPERNLKFKQMERKLLNKIENLEKREVDTIKYKKIIKDYELKFNQYKNQIMILEETIVANNRSSWKFWRPW
jgi:hypothetical protein